MGKNKFKKKPGGSLETRRQRLKEAKKDIAKETTGKKGPPKYSVEQLLEKAEDCIDRFEYEMAQKFCQRALEMEPDNVQALETTGTLLLELGNPESAKHCFGRAVEVCPEKGYSKYMYLGQLFEGAQAVQCFQKGVELIIEEHEAKQQAEVAAACGGPQEPNTMGQELSSAYLSIAEIYMTDLCMEEDAETRCSDYIKKAIQCDPDNPEAYQSMASYLLSKENEPEATEMIKKSVSLWLPKYKAADKGEVTDEEFNEVELTPLSYDTRVSTAKILTEVKEYETAIDVLEGLLDENDEVPQVWYMIGWANHLMGSDYKENARYYLRKSQKVIEKVKCEDEDLVKHVTELLQEIGPGDGDDVDDDEEEEGEDVADSDIDIESEDEMEEGESSKSQGADAMEH